MRFFHGAEQHRSFSPAATLSRRQQIRHVSYSGILLTLLVSGVGINPAAAINETKLGAPEVPITNDALPKPPPTPTPTPVPTPVPCINPAAEVAPGHCRPGCVHIYAYTGVPDGRCIPTAPDYPLRPSNYSPDCSRNDSNSCLPCQWHQPSCQIVSRVQYQSLDPSYHNREFIPFEVAAYVTGAEPACLDNIINYSIAMGAAFCGAHPEYCDDYVRGFITAVLGVDLAHPGNSMACAGFGGGTHYVGVCTSGFIYLDRYCRLLPVSTAYSWGCAAAQIGAVSNLWGSSPISLEWRGDRPVESIASVVTFPVKPGVRNRWYLWRGSADSPLLVYDPKHTGEIVSGEQLFGNWTFGGKRTASLKGSAAFAQEWRDGFEALGTLDINHDGAISGTERAPLGLWFDRDQDGVAQSGEVVPLEGSGVTRIALGPTRSDPIHGLVTVDQGYERIESGRTVSGRAVDWFAKEHAEPSALYLDWSFSDSARTIEQSDAPHTPDTGFGAAAPAPKRDSKLRGVWEWTFQASDGTIPAQPLKGLLVLNEKEGGAVEGISLAEAALESSKASERLSMLRFVMLEGTISDLGKGGRVLRFSLINPEGVTTQSEAVLSADGSALVGRTRETHTNTHGEARTFDYRWKAKKAAGIEK